MLVYIVRRQTGEKLMAATCPGTEGSRGLKFFGVSGEFYGFGDYTSQ